MTKIQQYAKKILDDHNCPLTSYWGTDGETIISDLKEAYPEGMEYPYYKVANAIMQISKPTPIKRPMYRMTWDTDSCCDGTYYDSFGAAKADAEDTLINWHCEEMSEWNRMPTEDQIESYDYMIWNCSVRVDKYDPDTDDYYEVWSPSYEEEKQIGWVEWDELKESYEHYLNAME